MKCYEAAEGPGYKNPLIRSIATKRSQHCDAANIHDNKRGCCNPSGGRMEADTPSLIRLLHPNR